MGNFKCLICLEGNKHIDEIFYDDMICPSCREILQQFIREKKELNRGHETMKKLEEAQAEKAEAAAKNKI